MEWNWTLIGSKKAVQDVQDQQKVCVLDIEIEGVKQIRDSHLNPLLVFIMPPSIEELEKRLTNRKTETAESLHKRLKTASSEIAYGACTILAEPFFSFYHKALFHSGQTPGNFHRIILNHDLAQAYKELSDFIAEELEAQRVQGVTVNVTRLPVECK